MRRCPWVPQLEPVECGAAALASVLAFHGKWLTLAELRQRCGVSRDGSRASRILRAARDLGCVAKGLRCSLSAISDIPLPAIIHWKNAHFVVLEHVGGNLERFLIVDPARGRREVLHEEFAASYSGVVLSVEPGENFIPGGRPPSTLELLFGNWRCGYGWLAQAVVATAGVTGAALLSILVLSEWVNEVLATDQSIRLGSLTTGLVAATGAFFISGVWRRIALFHVGSQISIDDTSEFLHRLIRFPWSVLQQRSSRDWALLLPRQSRRGELLQDTAGIALLETPVIPVMGGLLFYWDQPLAAIAVTTGVALSVGAWISARALRPYAEQQEDSEAQLEARTRLGLDLHDHLLCQGQEESYLRGRYHLQKNALTAFFNHWNQRMKFQTFGRFFLGAGLCILVVTGAWQVQSDTMSPGEVAAFFLTLILFFLPVLALAQSLPDLQEFRSIWLERREFMEIATLPDVEESREGEKANDAVLRLDRVDFSYSPFDPPALRDVSMDLRRGQMIAVVGGSGSGKSTLAKVAAGVFAPQCGVLTDAGLRVGWVDQDIQLFSANLLENVTLWDPEISHADAAHALSLAQLPLGKFPQGWNSMVENGGENLSGGERQRLAIARVVARKPDLIVLDESTAALDTETQARVIEGLRHSGFGILLTTHRLEAVRMADQILVLQDGQIVEQGTFDSLAKGNSHFSELFVLSSTMS